MVGSNRTWVTLLKCTSVGRLKITALGGLKGVWGLKCFICVLYCAGIWHEVRCPASAQFSGVLTKDQGSQLGTVLE